MKPSRDACIGLMLVALAGCASAPGRLARPDLKTQAPLAGVPVDDTARWPAAEWWKRFDDPQLDDLEARALQGAPSLATAQARYTVAVKSVGEARAQGGFSLDANAQAQRQRLSENGLFPTQFLGFTWYNQGDLGVQASYEFDFWGRRRAAVEAALDQARAAQAESNAAALMLTTGVADTYFSWQGDQARIALARAALSAQQRNHAVVAARTGRGVEDPDALHKADADLAQAREQLAALQGSAKLKTVALAALLGMAPADLPPLQPRALPVIADGLPDDAALDLVARRPDVAASRWRVESALQGVRQARAAFFPDISLKAMAGFSSIDLGKMLDSGSRVFDIGPLAMHLPLFDGGSLRARYGVSRAQLDSAIADYDSAVVDAAREAGMQALTLQTIEQRMAEQSGEVAATRRAVDTAAARVRQGVTDARALSGAQVRWLQQRDALAALQTQKVSADIALIKALGGGFRDQPSREQAPDIIPTGRAEQP